jgi:DNA-binding XRE family transcriptional regulator/desulfoferrodoxin (superoxide reductase-like protein)
MDCNKVGKLIFSLRKENRMTQKQLADAMNISDKTISKWERGLGCPDVSLLRELSEILDVNIERILLGNLEPNDADGGNMKKVKFYVCSNCGNTLTATGEAEVSCCGRKLVPLVPNLADEIHKLTVEEVENDFYVTFTHEMSKTHYISFIAYVTCDRALLIRLYPEQNGEVRFPKMYGGKIYYCCNQHGLWVNG